MTASDFDARRAVEARLAEAKAALAAAERAYREVVPCEHPTMTIGYDGEGFHCTDCGIKLGDPRGCQHHRIDNRTEQCIACREKMVRARRETVTVLSAPNAAACTIPDCEGGPGCENPDGVYVPDYSREQAVPIRWDVTYECARCRYDGDVFVSGEAPVWDCGHDHRGDSVPVPQKVAA